MTNSPNKTNGFERDDFLLLLHEVQKKYSQENYIPDAEIQDIARKLKMPLSEADGVASFYSLFARTPRGQYVIRLCDSLSCRITGSMDILYHIKESLGIRNGETTQDGLFTLEIVNCLGSCDTAPNMMVNDVLYKNLNPDKVDVILSQLKAEAAV
jgi:NADH:ubiquinone oxidoreductase subunit E